MISREQQAEQEECKENEERRGGGQMKREGKKQGKRRREREKEGREKVVEETGENESKGQRDMMRCPLCSSRHPCSVQCGRISLPQASGTPGGSLAPPDRSSTTQ